MEILAVVGILLLVMLGLGLYAGLIHVVLVKISARYGYCKDTIPLHYHMFAMGFYFTTLFLALFVMR